MIEAIGLPSAAVFLSLLIELTEYDSALSPGIPLETLYRWVDAENICMHYIHHQKTFADESHQKKENNLDNKDAESRNNAKYPPHLKNFLLQKNKFYEILRETLNKG